MARPVVPAIQEHRIEKQTWMEAAMNEYFIYYNSYA